MSETYYDVRKVKKAPQGGFALEIIHKAGDVRHLDARQITTDLFTPDPEKPPMTAVIGSTSFEGTLGDPQDGDPAILTIHELEVDRNRRRARLGSGAYRHANEGELWVISNE